MAPKWRKNKTAFLAASVRQGLKVDFLGVTQEHFSTLSESKVNSGDHTVQIVHGAFRKNTVAKESRFPFTELPFDGIFGLGLGGLSVSSSARRAEHWTIWTQGVILVRRWGHNQLKTVHRGLCLLSVYSNEVAREPHDVS